MSAFKRILIDDKNVVPFDVNKEYDIPINKLPIICQEPTEDDIRIYTGQKLSTPFHKENELKNNDRYQKSIYNQIKKLFYNDSSRSFNYNNNVDLIKNFPTDENSFIRVIEIPQNKFGNNIKPNEFLLDSNFFKIVDDGVGNLFDVNYIDKIHVGNIFYNQGIVVITNQDYKCMFPIEPVSFDKRYKFTVGSNKVINLLSDVIVYCDQTVITNSVIISNESVGFSYVDNEGIITINTDVVGTYSAEYTFKDSLGICSNSSNIIVEIVDVCSFDLEFGDVSSISEPCYSSNPSYEIVNISRKSHKSNGIDIYFDSFNSINVRNNGINDFELKFSSPKVLKWEISKNGGINYDLLSNSGNVLIINTLKTNTATFLRDSFYFILKCSEGNSYSEYIFKINPINFEYSFEKTKEYLDVSLLDVDELSSVYQVVSNNCDIIAINWTFTDELSGVVLDIDKVAILGCKGTAIAEIESRCCETVTKIIKFNGNCIETNCDTNFVELEVIPTNKLNNYIIFCNTNFYLKEHPQWSFNGSVQYLSDLNSMYLEVNVNNYDINNTLIFRSKDFCHNLYALHKFNVQNETIIPPIPNTTLLESNREAIDIEYADLELTLSASNLQPITFETVVNTLLIKNKGFSVANNVYIKVEYDNMNLIIDEESIQQYSYQIINNVIYFRTNQIKVGDYFSVKFNVRVLASVGVNPSIYAQIYEVDELDFDSTFNNGYIGEDDDSKITFLVKSVSNTTIQTTFNCKPFIREYPYTNFVCSVYNDFRGNILVNAVNPFTHNSDGLEYSFKGDVDIYYQEKNQSELLTNGLYDVWVRLKSNKNCKSKTKVRVSCTNGGNLPTWSLDGEICIN